MAGLPAAVPYKQDVGPGSVVLEEVLALGQFLCFHPCHLPLPWICVTCVREAQGSRERCCPNTKQSLCQPGHRSSSAPEKGFQIFLGAPSRHRPDLTETLVRPL